jgi:phospholipid transport system substrate-binding protein
LPFASAKAPEGTPTRAIQDLDDKLDDYKTGTALTPEDREFNRNLKREILYGTFDIRELSQLALSKHWNERTPQEQDYFVQVLTDLLENRAILSKEQGQKKAKTENIYTITYKGDKYLNAEKTRVLTRTSVYVKSEDIRVELDYKLKKVDNIWRAYDVIVDNASLLDNYKYQFDSIIKKNGYPDLIKRMENKLTSLKNKSAK